MRQALWERWCAGPHRPRRAAPRTPLGSALAFGGVIAWWGVPFILIDLPAIALAWFILN